MQANARRLGWPLVATAMLALAAACVGPFASGSSTPTPTPTPSATTMPSPTPTPEPTTTRPVVFTRAEILTSDLNVRVGPGREYPAIGRLQPGDEVGILGRSEDEQWLALAGLGWSFYESSWYQLDAPFAELPAVGLTASAAPTHPPGTDTGFPLLNDVIAEIGNGAADLLASLVGPRSAPCVTGGDAAAGPACPAGTTAGTAVDAIALRTCGDEWLPADAAAEAVRRLLTNADGEDAPLGLYAVLAAAPEDPAATYVILFAFESGEGRALWLGQSGAITRIAVGCDGQPAGHLMIAILDDLTYYVAPLAPEPLSPLQ